MAMPAETKQPAAELVRRIRASEHDAEQEMVKDLLVRHHKRQSLPTSHGDRVGG